MLAQRLDVCFSLVFQSLNVCFSFFRANLRGVRFGCCDINAGGKHHRRLQHQSASNYASRAAPTTHTFANKPSSRRRMWTHVKKKNVKRESFDVLLGKNPMMCRRQSRMPHEQTLREACCARDNPQNTHCSNTNSNYLPLLFFIKR